MRLILLFVFVFEILVPCLSHDGDSTEATSTAKHIGICRDTDKNCGYHKRENQCNSDSPHIHFMKEHCPVTCGFCDPSNSNPATSTTDSSHPHSTSQRTEVDDCVDHDNDASYCRDMSIGGFCAHHYSMKSRCAYSCHFCSVNATKRRNDIQALVLLVQNTDPHFRFFVEKKDGDISEKIVQNTDKLLTIKGKHSSVWAEGKVHVVDSSGAYFVISIHGDEYLMHPVRVSVSQGVPVKMGKSYAPRLEYLPSEKRILCLFDYELYSRSAKRFQTPWTKLIENKKIDFHWSSTVVHQGSLYVAAGATKSNVALSKFMKLKLVNKHFTGLKDTEIALYDTAMTSDGSIIYECGGGNGRHNYKKCWFYKTETNIWATMTALPFNTFGYTGGLISTAKDRLFVFSYDNKYSYYNGSAWSAPVQLKGADCKRRSATIIPVDAAINWLENLLNSE